MKPDEIKIPAPCDEDWNAMREAGPDAAAVGAAAKRRYCEACSFHVVDLSSLAEEDARKVIRAPRDERLCVSYIVRRDGTIRFADSDSISGGAVMAASRAGSSSGGNSLGSIASDTPRRARLAPSSEALVQIRRPMRRATLAVALAACTPHGDANDQPQVDAVEVSPAVTSPAYVVPAEPGTAAVEVIVHEQPLEDEIRVKGDMPPPPTEYRLQGKPAIHRDELPDPPPPFNDDADAPCDPPPDSPKPAPRDPDEYRKKGKLMIVDDDPLG